MRSLFHNRAARALGLVSLFGVAGLALVAALHRPAPQTTPTRLLRDDTGLYPRLVRLGSGGAANGRILASVVSFAGDSGIGVIYESTNGGVDFSQVGTIADGEAAGGKGLCCATLYELPQAVGGMPAGTLLWAASFGQQTHDRRMSLRIWKSNDIGRTWQYLSSCAVAPNTGGLWEPEFSVARDGRLVCHYSDETDPRYSQKLVEVRSSDGVTWGDGRDTVASSRGADRPGMAVVRRLADGSYFMSYEICAPGSKDHCVVYYRTSADGWDWGSPIDPGIRVATADGKFFRHAPNNALGPDGKLYLIGQVLHRVEGGVAPGNGQTIFVNERSGAGPWSEIAAPVAVPGAYDNYCPNYSSALLPSADGASLLEIATAYDGTVCKPYYAIGSATAPANGAGATSFEADDNGAGALADARRSFPANESSSGGCRECGKGRSR